MVSKTKTKARKRKNGRQTKGSKKSKSTVRKKSDIKKSSQRKTSSAVARTRKVSGKPKKTITSTVSSSTISPSTQETKILDQENVESSSDEDTTPQIQEESVPGVSQARGDEDVPSSSTAIADEDVDNENNTMTEQYN